MQTYPSPLSVKGGLSRYLQFFTPNPTSQLPMQFEATYVGCQWSVVGGLVVSVSGQWTDGGASRQRVRATFDFVNGAERRKSYPEG